MAKNNETTAPVAAIKALVTSGGVTDVGKTTISKHIASLLKKRGRDAVHIGVEMDHKKIDGEDRRIGFDYDDIVALNTELVASSKDIVIDVGGENFNPLADKMAELGDGLIRRFTHVVVPITDDVKEENIVSTIENLVNRGLPAEKIYLVFNKVVPSLKTKIYKTFASAILEVKEMGVNVVDVPVMRSELIAEKRGLEPIFDVNTDADTLEAEAKAAVAAGDSVRAEQLAQKVIEADMAKMAASNIEAVLRSIFKI